MSYKKLFWKQPTDSADVVAKKAVFDKLANDAKLNEAFESGDPNKAMEAIFKVASGMCVKGPKK